MSRHSFAGSTALKLFFEGLLMSALGLKRKSTRVRLMSALHKITDLGRPEPPTGRNIVGRQIAIMLPLAPLTDALAVISFADGCTERASCLPLVLIEDGRTNWCSRRTRH